MPIIINTLRPGPTTEDNPAVELENGQPAVIRIGRIEVDDTDSLWNQPTGDNISIWTDFEIHSKYEKDGHIYMMPISSPTGFSPQGNLNSPGNPPPGGTIRNSQVGQTAAFVQLASATLLWIVDWTACRFNEQPEIPDPYSPADSNWILMDDGYETVSLAIPPDGQTGLYRISGTYVYGHKNPASRTVDNVTFPRHPAFNDLFPFTRTMPAEKLKPNLMDAVGLAGFANFIPPGIGIGLGAGS